MRRPSIPLLIFVALAVTSLSAQPPRIQHFEYIDKYADEAMRQMAIYRIPASVKLAQAIFESSCGRSELAKRSNNHFGIKCHSAWQGDTVVKNDDVTNECFRKYENIEDSYTDHSIFISTRKWYTQLFELDITDYRGWCQGLKAAGYATFSGYADELIRIIEQNQLYKLDRAERLTPRVPEAAVAEIRPVNRDPRDRSLRDFSKHRLLFMDERDIYVRSLELIVISPDEFSDLVVGR